MTMFWAGTAGFSALLFLRGFVGSAGFLGCCWFCWVFCLVKSVRISALLSLLIFLRYRFRWFFRVVDSGVHCGFSVLSFLWFFYIIVSTVFFCWFFGFVVSAGFVDSTPYGVRCCCLLLGFLYYWFCGFLTACGLLILWFFWVVVGSADFLRCSIW